MSAPQVNRVRAWWLDRQGLRIRPVFLSRGMRRSHRARIQTINVHAWGEIATRTVRRDDIYGELQEAVQAMTEYLRIAYNVMSAEPEQDLLTGLVDG